MRWMFVCSPAACEQCNSSHGQSQCKPQRVEGSSTEPSWNFHLPWGKGGVPWVERIIRNFTKEEIKHWEFAICASHHGAAKQTKFFL